MLIIVMGVSGSGKSTIGRALAERLGWEYLEGDDFHPRSNIEKMASGNALTDDDRMPWLRELANAAAKVSAQGKGAVIACSALKEKYRAVLRDAGTEVKFVWLRGSEELISKRMTERVHFMNPKLLTSQFEALEEPQDAWTLQIEQSPLEIVTEIANRIESQKRTSHEAS